MVAGKGARKALARALSQVVLSRETILVHAESVLEHAELVEGSLHSSAFNLWFAVLQRAEAEGALERLVAAVLEDNPGADRVRQALQDWQLATAAAPAASQPLPRALEASPPSSSARLAAAAERAPSSERARWAVLAALLMGFAALFLMRALRTPGPQPEQLRPQAISPAVPASALAEAAPGPRAASHPSGSPVQVGQALRTHTLVASEARSGRDAGVEPDQQVARPRWR